MALAETVVSLPFICEDELGWGLAAGGPGSLPNLARRPQVSEEDMGPEGRPLTAPGHADEHRVGTGQPGSAQRLLIKRIVRARQVPPGAPGPAAAACGGWGAAGGLGQGAVPHADPPVPRISRGPFGSQRGQREGLLRPPCLQWPRRKCSDPAQAPDASGKRWQDGHTPAFEEPAAVLPTTVLRWRGGRPRTCCCRSRVGSHRRRRGEALPAGVHMPRPAGEVTPLAILIQ